MAIRRGVESSARRWSSSPGDSGWRMISIWRGIGCKGRSCGVGTLLSFGTIGASVVSSTVGIISSPCVVPSAE